MPCRFASSGPVATSRSASRAILALNAASNFLRDLVISVLHRLRQSRTLHTLTFGPISGVHFIHPDWTRRGPTFFYETAGSRTKHLYCPLAVACRKMGLGIERRLLLQLVSFRRSRFQRVSPKSTSTMG